MIAADVSFTVVEPRLEVVGDTELPEPRFPEPHVEPSRIPRGVWLLAAMALSIGIWSCAAAIMGML